MAKVINITDKLTNEKPKIQIGEKIYEVNDSIVTAFKFQELAQQGTQESFIEAFKIALGEEAVKELEIEKMNLYNLRVIVIAILAAMQDMDYEEAEKRFRNF